MMMLPSYVPISLLSAPVADSVVGWLFDEPTVAALIAYEYDYVRRAGYALGAHGEWVSTFPATGDPNEDVMLDSAHRRSGARARYL
jgi:hypothetical protein